MNLLRVFPRTLCALPAVALCLTMAAVPASASRTHRAPTAGHAKARRAKKHEIKGQRQIDPARATQIQQALIKQNYLTGEPTGEWDAQTQAAMQKFQADNGSQTKLTPDSHALIKLGLGPSSPSGLQTASQPAMTIETPAPVAPSADANTLAAAHSISN